MYGNAVVVLILSLIARDTYVCCSTQPHLGCYKENTLDRDLPFEVWTNRSTDLNVTECMIGCQSAGYPYAGLGIGGQECFCGTSFGKYGKTEDCLYVCLGFPSYKCGGSNEYNIYYTVQQETLCPSKTQFVIKQPYDVCLSAEIVSDVTTFQEARTRCLKQNQDLLIIDSTEILSLVKDIITNSSQSHSSVWLGLYRPQENGQFEWVSKYTEIDHSEIHDYEFWDNSHPKSNKCAFYNTATGKLETGNCDMTHSLMCQSTLDKTSLVIHKSVGDKIAEFFADKGNLAMVVVILLVALILSGCIVAYCFHKKHKEKKKAARERKVLNRPNMFMSPSKIDPQSK